MNHYVYRHIRVDTNEPFYVGLGTKEPHFNSWETEYRRAFSLRRNPFWERVSEKTDYEVEILFESDSYEEVKQKEIEFIKLYGRRDKGLGPLTNLTDGGDGHGLNAIPIVVLNLKSEFIAEYSSIREASKITGVKDGNIIAICNGDRRARKYIFLYKEDYAQGEVYDSKSWTTPIEKYTLGGILIDTFASVKDACISVGKKLSCTGVGNCCREEVGSAYKYKWKYKNKI